VWIPVKNLSEITGVAEETIRKTLTEQNLVIDTFNLKRECTGFG
jgi:DeoR/GlpR family transcriptional regulator of sugar metabolism